MEVEKRLVKANFSVNRNMLNFHVNCLIFSALKEFHETFKHFEFSKETAERDRGREGALLRQRWGERPDAGPAVKPAAGSRFRACFKLKTSVA